VAGLIAAGDRRSVQPMAARDDQVGYDQLHHFVAARVWDSASRSDSPRTSEGTRK
jgi:hypothetical protein